MKMSSLLKNELIRMHEDKKVVDKKIENTIGVSLIIKQKLNNMFVYMRDERNLDEKRVGLHASAIIAGDSDFCIREQVLSLIYEQSQGKELPVGSLKIFAAGSSIHEKWQKMFTVCSEKIPGFKLVRVEARSFSEKWKLYFTPDAIVEINEKNYIVEIKSMNEWAYKSAMKSKNPHPSARKQLQLYMHLTGIHNGLILLENKNNQDFELFEVHYEYDEVVKYLDRLQEIKSEYKDLVKNKIEPERICKASTVKRAKECNMCKACFGIGVKING